MSQHGDELLERAVHRELERLFGDLADRLIEGTSQALNRDPGSDPPVTGLPRAAAREL